MGLFSQRNPRREVTVTTKTYATEFDKEPVKQKKGLFSQKKEPEPQPQTMEVENNQNEDEYANQEENYGGTY